MSSCMEAFPLVLIEAFVANTEILAAECHFHPFLSHAVVLSVLYVVRYRKRFQSQQNKYIYFSPDQCIFVPTLVY